MSGNHNWRVRRLLALLVCKPLLKEGSVPPFLPSPAPYTEQVGGEIKGLKTAVITLSEPGLRISSIAPVKTAFLLSQCWKIPMLPQPWDFAATAYLSPDKARLKYGEEGGEKTKQGKTKLRENNESLIKRRRQEQRCRWEIKAGAAAVLWSSTVIHSHWSTQEDVLRFYTHVINKNQACFVFPEALRVKNKHFSGENEWMDCQFNRVPFSATSELCLIYGFLLIKEHWTNKLTLMSMLFLSLAEWLIK